VAIFWLIHLNFLCSDTFRWQIFRNQDSSPLQPVKRVSQLIKALTATGLLLALGESALPTPAPDYFRMPRGATLAVAQNTAKPAAKPKPERFTTGSSPALESGTTPNVGSPEWKKEQAENERKEQRLKSIINSICRGC
jgi:hypothetical protein